MKERILVTGGTGYIGSHTVVELQNSGYEVIIIDNLSNSSADVVDNIEKVSGIRPVFEKLDCLDFAGLDAVFTKYKGIKAIIHFAASKAVGESVQKPLLYYRNNLVSLINLLELMPKHGVEGIVFSSSCTVYGQPSFATGRPFFFTIGQIRRKKNFHLLVDVMRHFPEYDLYICGDAHFAYAEEVRNLIREKQVTNVFLTDVITQSEKIWLYRNCEAFLFPSEGEGFGLPVVEAMQFGKAVFAANRTSLPEVCNGHAIMWEHLDTESMVQSIREHLPDFYKDEERLTRMKEHAASFSYEKHIQAYLDLYRELAQLS